MCSILILVETPLQPLDAANEKIAKATVIILILVESLLQPLHGGLKKMKKIESQSLF